MIDRAAEGPGDPCRRSILLFVYGSLLTGNAARRPFRRFFEAVGEGSVAGDLYHLPEGYPTLILAGAGDGAGAGADDADRRVNGEIIRLVDPPAALVALDEYEGAGPDLGDDGLYVRIAAPVRLVGGGGARCWIYACPGGAEAEVRDRGRRVESGSWRAFLSGA